MSSECAEKSGTVKGSCASGFGVCCVFIIDDDDNTDVNQNDTYIQNPNFPSAYDEDNSITYKVNKISDGMNNSKTKISIYLVKLLLFRHLLFEVGF